jgi:putative ABC transport system ATP-binding protein
MTLRVEWDDLVVGWPQRPLVKNIPRLPDFEELNYVLPIIGPTGSGKSTLLYALGAMAIPIGGRIRWHFPDACEPCAAWSSDHRTFTGLTGLRRRGFGFCLQDASMIPCFTVAENLRHTLRLRGVVDDLEARIRRAVGYMLPKDDSPEEFLRKYPIKLSGGERQRMALAAAIAHDPVVLFADEPTASLDVKAELRVLDALRGWLDDPTAKGKRAIVFVTHRVETLGKGIGARRALNLPDGKDGDAGGAELPNVRQIAGANGVSNQPAPSASGSRPEAE